MFSVKEQICGLSGWTSQHRPHNPAHLLPPALLVLRALTPSSSCLLPALCINETSSISFLALRQNMAELGGGLQRSSCSSSAVLRWRCRCSTSGQVRSGLRLQLRPWRYSVGTRWRKCWETEQQVEMSRHSTGKRQVRLHTQRLHLQTQVCLTAAEVVEVRRRLCSQLCMLLCVCCTPVVDKSPVNGDVLWPFQASRGRRASVPPPRCCLLIMCCAPEPCCSLVDMNAHTTTTSIILL